MGSSVQSQTPESSESYLKTIRYLCQMMTNKKHLPICSQLTNHNPANISTYTQRMANDDMGEQSQNISLVGLLEGAFFILLILAVATWRKGLDLEVCFTI